MLNLSYLADNYLLSFLFADCGTTPHLNEPHCLSIVFVIVLVLALVLIIRSLRGTSLLA